MLKGLQVTIPSANGREHVHTILRLHEDNARYEFEVDKEGDMSRKTTVYDYFRETRRIDLRYPEFNLLDVSKTKKRSQGNPVLVPAELCTIRPGQISSTGTKYADQVPLTDWAHTPGVLLSSLSTFLVPDVTCPACLSLFVARQRV